MNPTHIHRCVLSAAAAALLLLLTTGSSAMAATTIHDLQARWAQINYGATGDAQLAPFKKLMDDAEAYTTTHPDEADGWIWSGIIKATYAGAKGGLGALGLAKSARQDLETALGIDGDAMNGSAYTTLGTLYLKVPGWPLGFGNDKKAGDLLRKGLELNPDGIDSNYFFAQYLRAEGNDAEARRYFERALAAPPRPDRPLADQGRHGEIEVALAELGAS